MTDMEHIRDNINDVTETVAEEIRLRGREIGVQLRDLVREGNARKLILRDSQDRKILEVSLTAGVVGGLAFLLFVPPRILAVLGILALFVRIYLVLEPMEIVETEQTRTTASGGKRTTKSRTTKVVEAS
jgi:phage shock protein PspC (stress-responsive transcriptional regulator)